ncbi:MAG: hypothetical protein Q4C30_05600 [Bacteroidia bacterium]|nr:hypothetical protein [Bacteroidia bacterium]
MNGNILVNLQKASDEGTSIQAAIYEYRGVTNVWEVVLNMEKVFELPGGIYNLRSAGSLNSYELFMKAASLMGLKEYETMILPEEERFYEQPRNLTTDGSLAEGFGIHLSESVEGIEKALNSPIIRF